MSEYFPEFSTFSKTLSSNRMTLNQNLIYQKISESKNNYLKTP